jgi:diguanylate cyclase (GGDEF)-like protein/PAS domain S-box-containing protein
MLVATILILSFSLIGYLYWHNSQRYQLEDIANHYHLETILSCSQIKEEVFHILAPQVDSQFRFQHADGQGQLQTVYTNAVYLIQGYIQTISQLHGVYGTESDQAARFEPIIRKINRQFTGIKGVLEDARVNGIKPFVQSGTSQLESFAHSIEQLRRLHTIAKDVVNGELNTLKTSSTGHLVMIFTGALLFGALILWRILTKIRRLVEAQRQTDSTLQQSATVFECASEGVLIADVGAKIISVNKAFTNITGYSEEDVSGKNASILKSGRHDQEFYKTMWSSLLQHGEWKGEIWGRRKNGEVFPKWQTIRAVQDDDGRLTHYVSVFSDISHIKESEEQLHQLAHHDALTGLPNRLLLNARLEHSLQHAHREGTNVAVLFLDLDCFKKINDTLGHPAGDRLLQVVAERLSVSIREEDTVARLGGDELTIVLGHVDDARHAATVAQAVLDKLSKPFELEGQDVFLSVSIGICLYPHDGRDVTTLLKNADAAMYMAKSEGRNGYHFYSEELSYLSTATRSAACANE